MSADDRNTATDIAPPVPGTNDGPSAGERPADGDSHAPNGEDADDGLDPADPDAHEIVEGAAEPVEIDAAELESDQRYTRAESVDEVIVEALAEGLTQVAAARRAHTTDRTVRRRLENPAFVRRVRDARRRMTDEATGRTTALLTDAVDQIGDLLHTGDASTRLRAATLVLRLAGQAAVVDDFTQRLEQLEAVIVADDDPELNP